MELFRINQKKVQTIYVANRTKQKTTQLINYFKIKIKI